MAELTGEETFLIEIRLARTKWRIKRITEKITTLFSVPESAERHPHLTLFGPFSLRKGCTSGMLQKAVGDAARPFSAIPYLISGYDMNQGLNGAVIAYRVLPSDSLVRLNAAISSAVSPLADDVNVWDTDPRRKWFHVTIANRLDRTRGSEIFGELMEKAPAKPSREDGQEDGSARSSNGLLPEPPSLPAPPVLDEDGIRVSIVHGDAILAEYDLLRHRWFDQNDPKRALMWRKSLQLFRRERGMELTAPKAGSPDDIFVIGDLHLGHANIIRYCSRPFPHDAVGEMDKVLIRNWNCTVMAENRAYCLGDLSYGHPRPDPASYLRKLNGSVTLVKGNHDGPSAPSVDQETLTHHGIPFILVHDPADAPKDPGAWVVHGHYHNNDLEGFPFISFEHRRINASCEVVGYRPVSLSELAGIIRDHDRDPAQKRILLRSL